MRTRIGISRAAFQQIKRMVLCNRRLPLMVRARLFKALILSKLYYGAGAWTPLSQTTLKRLRSALVSMVRQILGVGPQDESHLTTNSILLRLQVLDPLVYIGVERLRYAASLFQHGWQDLHKLLEAEHHHGTQSWLAGLYDAVHWFNDVAMQPDEIPTDIESLKDYWCLQGHRWKRTLMKVTRRHLVQEQTMEQVKQYHRTFFKTLRSSGANFWPDPFAMTGSDLTYSCACGRAFSTGQGLATHKRKAHGIFSPEHQFLQGATCPHCLKFFWSTQRLQQHLRYIPRKLGYNACFAALLAAGYTADYEAVPRPRHVQGLQRVETQPTFGPHMRQATSHDKALDRWGLELTELEAEDEVMVVPRNQETTITALHGQWSQVTLTWFMDFTLRNYEPALSRNLPDLWIDVFVKQEDDIEDWLQDAFLDWGTVALPDVLSTWEDGEAEILVETEYYRFIVDFPRYQRQTRISELRRLLAQPAVPYELSQQPHRAPRPVGSLGPSTKPAFPGIERAYGQQQTWHDRLRDVNWSDTIEPKPLPVWKEVRAKLEVVVAHLFSGRRRVADFHEHLNQWAEEHYCNIVVLSLDTAVSSHYGNLHNESVSWQHFLTLLRSGAITGALTGSPCETYSAARHHPPPPDWEGARWPRPLRSHDRLFGLEKLSNREMRQLHQGTMFFMQVVEVLVWMMALGGVFVAEHPATPADPSFASTWRSAIIQLLLKHPSCKLERVQQYRWGCTVRKPTGLLHFNIPRFVESIYTHSMKDAQPPEDVAIGMQNGQFLTSSHKEYPPLFGKALAWALGDGVAMNFKKRGAQVAQDLPPDSLRWLAEAADVSSLVVGGRTFLPDYQGQ